MRIVMMSRPRRWLALVVALLAVLVDMVDNQIVGVALPTIQRELGTGQSALQWISAGYALGFALTLITGGRLGDRYGTKRLFLVGMTVFTVASLAAGLASHTSVLITARVVQGVGAGLMVPQVLSFIHAEFDETERPKAMGLFALTFPIGGMAGPLLGGLLTEGNLFGTGWRAIFLVNLPVGVLALVGALVLMPARPGLLRHRMDPRGLGLLVAGLFALFFPLVEGRELGWPIWLIGLLVAAVPCSCCSRCSSGHRPGGAASRSCRRSCWASAVWPRRSASCCASTPRSACSSSSASTCNRGSDSRRCERP